MGYVLSPLEKERIEKLPKLEKGEKLELKNGYYEVDIELYNEREDKLSMGNNALTHKANIFAEDGRYRIYIWKVRRCKLRIL